jgi:cell division septum initiation protein DivIVA
VSASAPDIPQTSSAVAAEDSSYSPEQESAAPPRESNEPETQADQVEKEQSGEFESELMSLKLQLDEARSELARRADQAASNNASKSDSDLIELSDERVLQEVGIYRYHHPLENSAEYRDKLDELQNRIKESVKSGDAITASNMFTFDNSLAKGRRMTSDLSKLMLRAYNAEADNCVRSLKAGNVITAKKRLEASVSAISKFGAMMEMKVSPAYHALRIEELELTSDFLMKVQEEKELAREERERLREERKVAQELAAERERLNKEREHHLNAIEALRASGDEEGIQALLDKLKNIDDAIAQNDYRAANIRCGYIYVISNEGAFGKDVVKIGLTRRLEPLDRIRELSGASVPFPFDVHALFFSEDAVTLETELHHAFDGKRVNCVNERKEFFFATPHEVRLVLAEKVGNLLEFTEEPDAIQFLQSKGSWRRI